MRYLGGMSEPMITPAVVAARMKASGLAIRAIAKAAGVSERTALKAAAGATNIQYGRLLKIAEWLDQRQSQADMAA
jgi:transcriptional regulator with XRE-family HTH domain